MSDEIKNLQNWDPLKKEDTLTKGLRQMLREGDSESEPKEQPPAPKEQPPAPAPRLNESFDYTDGSSWDDWETREFLRFLGRG